MSCYVWVDHWTHSLSLTVSHPNPQSSERVSCDWQTSAAICLQKWGGISSQFTSPPCPPSCPLFLIPSFPSPQGPHPVNTARGLGALGALRCILSWKSCLLLTQNQQSTTYLSYSWNSELTLYTNEQSSMLIRLNLGVSGHQDAPWSAPILATISTYKTSWRCAAAASCSNWLDELSKSTQKMNSKQDVRPWWRTRYMRTAVQ